MGRPNLEAGFKLWHDEVMDLERPEQPTPYIPVIALVGIYTALHANTDALTCYDWRRATLGSEYAREGLRRSLSSIFSDRVDEDFQYPVSILEPTPDAALQIKSMYLSIVNGLPGDALTIADNEVFLAEQAGQADHDYTLSHDPLRLTHQGMHALHNFYPKTAQLVEEYI